MFLSLFLLFITVIIIIILTILNKIDSILRKAHKFGYTTEVLKVTDMLQNTQIISSFRFSVGGVA